MAKKSKEPRNKKPKEIFLSYKRIRMTYGQTIAVLLVLGLALFAGSGTFFYRQIFSNPDQVLNDMLAKSLQTNSIQRNIAQTSQQSTIDQTYYNTFSPNTAMQSVVKLKEGDIRAGQVTQVTNETVGFKEADYVQYTAISLPEGSPNKDFSKVLNVWGKREKTDQGEMPAFLNESVFSIVPFGNLPGASKNEIIQEVDKVNLYDYKSSKVAFEGARPVITYEMSIKPESLLTVLSKYATITGFGDKEQLNPEDYKDSQDIQIEMKVDLISRHVKSISFTGSTRVETYGAYGIQRKIESPSQTIPINELQSRLAQFQ